MTDQPVRIQFVCDRVLEAEVIVESSKEVDRITAAYYRLKESRKKPLGGCLSCLAILPRYWDVPVGSKL